MATSSPDAPFASRGGLKLEAALTAFGLADALAGLEALDVGTGHGGFVDCLLRHGAARVTTVDVGHDQIRDPLRSDPRVVLLERQNFKTLPPRLLPGPFDFFTLDVSFASARSMLRPIALRLRPGVRGVALVKPQFELPKALTPTGGVVESRNLRKFAFNRFRRRALQTGFRILGRIDSPVAGGSGNVEILVHLVFDGLAVRSDGDGAGREPPEGTP